MRSCWEFQGPRLRQGRRRDGTFRARRRIVLDSSTIAHTRISTKAERPLTLFGLPQKRNSDPLGRSLVASYVYWSRVLFQRGVDRRELRVEVRADAIHHGDDSERNARRDQTVLDGGRAGLVFPEFANELLHVTHPGCRARLGKREFWIKTT